METEKKYKLTDESINFCGRKLYLIEALKDFAYVKKSDKGGFVESEYNLSQVGDCWIYNNAKVYGDAKVLNNAKIYNNAEVFGNVRIFGNADVSGNAKVYGNAQVYGNAKVYGNAEVYGDARICGEAKVNENAEVHGNAKVCGNVLIYGDAKVFGEAIVKGNATILSCSDYIVFKNWWSSGRYFTWTRSNNMWKVGCFYGTGEELIKKAYNDSELSGREYERVVKYVETILKDSEQ